MPALLGDIGGTHSRFALLDASGRIGDMVVLDNAEFAGLQQALEHYLRQAGQPVKAAALCVASPVLGDQIHLTNRDWGFSIDALRRALAMERLVVVNDFTAQALALPQLAAGDLHQVGGGCAVANGPQAVLGPGTGLGVSGVLPVPGSSRRWVAISGEGGHVTLPAADAGQARVVEALRGLPGLRQHVSAEKVLSGAGLRNLYRALAPSMAPDAIPRPEQITAAALSGGDPVAVQALERFFAFLGSVAGDLALTLGATGGVYIGGGIVPGLVPAIDASPFRENFTAKGRFADYLEAIPTWVIIRQNPALLGLKALLLQDAADD